jgi:hypothetical protein
MTDAPMNPGLDGRGREQSGRIDHKHPTTKIKHLREHYGKGFALVGMVNVRLATCSRKLGSNRSLSTLGTTATKR